MTGPMAGQVLPRSRKAKQDGSVMATNNSSIVSKRSVERTYYPEPHFYRYFVKKPLRRSPLINRGYWLRMHAVEQVVNEFLEQPSDKQKVILNLGCGYDPLAFQLLSKNLSKTQRCRFIDVDFPELMNKKREVIMNTPQLRDLLGPCETSVNPGGVFLRSAHYLALGCDLENISKLEDMLAKEIDIATSLILCTAEVSITYMDVKAANALIRWGAQYNDIRFCLLEQYLPDGTGHPFAQQMIKHFNNLHTPLNSILHYPQLADQERRFLESGWSTASARSLWDVWNDETLVTSDQRLALNSVEPFDEWEEFILFASHYLLLRADKGSLVQSRLNRGSQTVAKSGPSLNDPGNKVLIALSNVLPKSNVRRFGALFALSAGSIAHHGGLGPQSRVGTTNEYGLHSNLLAIPPDAVGIEPRMCHTISGMQHGWLLVGGRTSPEHALRDCWFFQEGRWNRVDNLPLPLYRHCATQVTLDTGDQGVLVYGGKTEANGVSPHWLLWRASLGWVEVTVNNKQLRPRFGAAMASTGSGSGILLGGTTADATILNDIWEWTLKNDEILPRIELSCARTSWLATHSVVGRMGACLTNSPIGLLLVGGVASEVLSQDYEIICLSRASSHDAQAPKWGFTKVDCRITGQRPLLVGHSTLTLNDLVIIIGGGAVCFSFGTYWSTELITLSTNNAQDFSALRPNPSENEVISPRCHSDVPAVVNTAMQTHSQELDPASVTKMYLGSPGDMDEMMKRRRPVLMSANDLGSCTRDWTLDTLKAKIGADRTVVVHETTDVQMDFQQKNFIYNKKSFRAFADEVAGGARQYFRSLASDKPTEDPADFWTDFPELAPDFELPPQLDMIRQKTHSSVLRISGPVSMWLHYDVMANVLCQIRGIKRLILYPPSDVSLLYLPPGASSSPINCFDPDMNKYPLLALAHPHEFSLEPGDILFIPPLWLHTASPIDNVSISINVFFRSLDSGYAPGRDVYGNRDVQAYERGRKDIEKMTRAFDMLPLDMGRFYLERLAAELKAKALQRRS